MCHVQLVGLFLEYPGCPQGKEKEKEKEKKKKNLEQLSFSQRLLISVEWKALKRAHVPVQEKITYGFSQVRVVS